MKKSLYTAVSIILSGFFLFACKRDLTVTGEYDNGVDKAWLRVIDVAPSFNAITGQPDTFNVYIDDARITTPHLSFGSSFPDTLASPYVAVNSGTHQIKLSIPGSIQNPDSATIYTMTKTLRAGEKYTFLITDSLKSSRDSSQIWVKDSFSMPAPGYYNLRFIHAVLNDTTGKKIDVFSARRNGNIFVNLAPGAITSFIRLPYNAQFADTLYVRRAGTTTDLTKFFAFAASQQRTYTIYYKGNGDFTSGKKERKLGRYVH